MKYNFGEKPRFFVNGKEIPAIENVSINEDAPIVILPKDIFNKEEKEIRIKVKVIKGPTEEDV